MAASSWPTARSDSHLAVVLAERLDRRVLAAVEYVTAARIPELHVLHFAFDPDAAMAFHQAWTDSPLWPIPITVIEATKDGLADACRAAVADLGAGFDQVTIVLPVLTLPRGVARVLHRGWGRDVADVLESADDVAVSLVPVTFES